MQKATNEANFGLLKKCVAYLVFLSFYKRLLIAFFLGLLTCFAQPPYDFFPVCFFSFPLLIWLMDASVSERSKSFIKSLIAFFLVGWCFGSGYFLGGPSISLAEIFREKISVFSVLDFFVFPFFWALFWGLATAVSGFFWKNGIGRIFFFALFLGFCEVLREYYFPGFSYNPIGFSLMPAPVYMQSIKITGIVGMHILAVLLFSLPAVFAFSDHRKIAAFLFISLMTGHIAFGVFLLSTTFFASSESFILRIMDPKKIFDEKPYHRDEAQKQNTQSLETKQPDLLIWPDFLSFERKSQDVLFSLKDKIGEGSVLLSRFIREEGEGEKKHFYNSVALMNAKGEVFGAMDKIFLQPFQDYLPFRLFWQAAGWENIFLHKIDFTKGTHRKVFDLAKSFKMIVYIDNEPLDSSAYLSDPKSFLVNIDSTKNRSFMVQKLRKAQINAVVYQKLFIVAMPLGEFAIIDPRGEMIDATSLHHQGIKDVDIGSKIFLQDFSSENQSHWIFWIRILGVLFLGWFFFYAIFTKRS